MTSNQIKKEGLIFIISGPSGSGKTTLAERLLKRGVFKNTLIRPVSFTTRLARRQERKDKDYHFLSLSRFNLFKKKGRFLESQLVFGNYYATNKKEVYKILKSGKDVLLCVDVKGARAIRRIFPKRTILIFILPPGFDILQERLKGRATERKEDALLRLKGAEREINLAKVYDYIVINDRLAEALKALEAIIKAERLHICREER